MKIDIDTAARLIAREQCRRMAAERTLRTVRAVLMGSIERIDGPLLDEPDTHDEAELKDLARNRLIEAMTLEVETYR